MIVERLKMEMIKTAKSQERIHGHPLPIYLLLFLLLIFPLYSQILKYLLSLLKWYVTVFEIMHFNWILTLIQIEEKGHSCNLMSQIDTINEGCPDEYSLSFEESRFYKYCMKKGGK